MQWATYGVVWRQRFCHRAAQQLEQQFTPHQLGVGIRGGAEAGAHAARIYINAAKQLGTPNEFLKMDFRNAFNEVRRDAVLTAVKDKIPQWFPYASQCYGTPSNLYWGTTPISSSCGVQQGDPLGPSLFALTIQPIVEAMGTEFNVWYLDDGTTADHPDTVLNALGAVMAMGEGIGLNLNPTKCEVECRRRPSVRI